MATVAVIGLGGMGSRMAVRLLDAGHDLVIWNRTPQRASDLVARGAVAADSPADADRRADLVITMLSDPAALYEVAEGPQGILAGATTSTTLAEMSTVGPAAVRRLTAAESAGVELPVAAAARQWVAAAREAGLGDRDYSAVIARITDTARSA